MELLRFGGGAKISLEAACLMVGIPSPKTGRVTSDAVWPAYRDGDFDGIAELCKGDVVATMQLHEKIEAAQRPRPAARRSAPAGR
jgi:predicted PolB exonuclease-like 3'-5' exonuclease